MTWESASTGSHVTFAMLVEILLANPVRVHDGAGTIGWNGHNWLGTGKLGQVSEITSGADLDAATITLVMGGIPSQFRSDIMNEVARGSRVNFLTGFIDKASGTWSLEPSIEHVGFTDAPTIEEEEVEGLGSVLTVSVPVLSASAYARRFTTSRRTSSDQKKHYAGDKFFDFKTSMRAPIPAPGAPGDQSAFDRAARRIAVVGIAGSSRWWS